MLNITKMALDYVSAKNKEIFLTILFVNGKIAINNILDTFRHKIHKLTTAIHLAEESIVDHLILYLKVITKHFTLHSFKIGHIYNTMTNTYTINQNILMFHIEMSLFTPEKYYMYQVIPQHIIINNTSIQYQWNAQYFGIS